MTNRLTRQSTSTRPRSSSDRVEKRRQTRLLIESLEPRRLLATVPVPDGNVKIFEPTASEETTYQFGGSSWTGVKIRESAQSIDTLDFSAVSEKLTFRIQAKNKVLVTGDTSDWRAEAWQVERFIPGSGENVFIVEDGGKLNHGEILGNAGLSTQSIVLSYTSDFGDPNKFFASGVSQRVTLDLAGGLPRAQSLGVEFDVVSGKIEFVGGLGPDSLTGETTVGNTIRGGKGNDAIAGGNEIDWLRGDNGDDTIRGGDGNDARSTGTGVDLAGLLGGDGDDEVFGEAGNDVLAGESGNDTLVGGAGEDTLYGGPQGDVLYGDHDVSDATATHVIGSDWLYGQSGDDRYVFAAVSPTEGWGQDTVVEASGNGTDTLDFSNVQTPLSVTLGGIAAEFITATTPNDSGSVHRVLSSNHIENVQGGTGVNTYKITDAFGTSLEVDGFLNHSLKVFNEIAVNDDPTAVLDLSMLSIPATIVVDKSDSADRHNLVKVSFNGGFLAHNKHVELSNIRTIIGSSVGDTITFNDGALLVGDLLGGSAGISVVYQYRPNSVHPGVVSAADLITALDISSDHPGRFDFNSAAISMTLSDDPDQLPSVEGETVNVKSVTGGRGNDFLFDRELLSDTKLAGGEGNDAIFGKAGNDTLIGDQGDDYVRGHDGDDVIQGGRNDDVLIGDAGNDTISGGSGNDRIIGAPDDDLLRGNGGADTFVYEEGWGKDTIETGYVDFRSDVLDLSATTSALTYNIKSNEIEVLSDAGSSLKTSSGPKNSNAFKTIITGSGSQTIRFGNDWQTAEFDTSAALAAGHSVVFDFSGSAVPLEYRFKKVDGEFVVTVSRVNGLTRGLVGSAIPGELDDYFLDKIGSTITIPVPDGNTTIISGSNDNFYRPIDGENFPGNLILTGGYRYRSLPLEHRIVDGLNVGHTLAVTDGVYDLTTQIDLTDNSVMGLNYATADGGRVTGIAYSGLKNFIRGNSDANTFLHENLLPGVHGLYGGLGPDTYSFTNFWGAAVVADYPDLDLLGTPIPESLDTLDFSRMVGSIEVDVFDVSVLGTDGAADWLLSHFGDFDISDFNIDSVLDIAGNFVLVRDVSIGAALDTVLGDSTDDVRSFLASTGTSFVAAMDIESIIGPQLGSMTIKMHGNAELRGTVSSGSNGTVTLDYSDYDSAVDVLAGRYTLSNLLDVESDSRLKNLIDSVQTYLIDGEVLPVLIDRPATSTARATGIGGNRLQGLTTVLDLPKIVGLENPISTALAEFGVTGLAKVIGSNHADSLIAERRELEFGAGLNDTVSGVLNLFEGGVNENLSIHVGTLTVQTIAVASEPILPIYWLDGKDLVSGRGNDHIVGSSADNVFYFQATDPANGWGIDVVTSGVPTGSAETVGRDVIDMTRIPNDWMMTWVNNPALDHFKIEVRDSAGTLLPHVIQIPRGDKNDLTLRYANKTLPLIVHESEILVSAGAAPANFVPQLATQFLGAAILNHSLPSIPLPAIEAALEAFNGKTLTVPGGVGGSSTTLNLSVVDSDDGTRRQLQTDAGVVLMDSLDVPLVITDLPDLQIASRNARGDILIDRTAAGHGWDSDGDLSVATGRVDLVSALVREFRFRLTNDATAVPLGVEELDRDVLPLMHVIGAVDESPQLVAVAIAGSIDQSTDLAPLIAQAVANWQASAPAGFTIDPPTVTVGHLPEEELVRTLADGTIRLDADAAGHGWFLDMTPASDSDVTTIGAARIDLLHVLMHEIGHSIGLGSDAAPTALMHERIAVATRRMPPAQFDVLGTLADQAKLEIGLAAFAAWTAGQNGGDSLADRFIDVLSPEVEIPFLGSLRMSDLLGIDAADFPFLQQITAGLQTDIIDNIQSVFQSGAPVTAQMIADLNHIEYAPSTNGLAFTATVPMPNLDYERTYALNLDDLQIGGFDPVDFGFSVRSDTPPELHVAAGVDLTFVFGLDADGQFYVENPTLSASVQVDSGTDVDGNLTPFDLDVTLGPLGMSVVGGSILIGGTMKLGTSARLSYAALVNNTTPAGLLLPSLGGDTKVAIDLPLDLTGALSGVNDEGLAIRAHGSFGDSIGSLESFIAGIDLKMPGLGNALELRGVSLDQILESIIAGLDALVDEDPENGSLIARKIPGLNQSAMDLFGDGTDDFIVGLKNAIVSVRENANTNLGSLADQLNAAVNQFFDGDPVNPFTITYEDSNLLVDFALERVLVEKAFDFSVDLNSLFQNEVQTFIDSSPLLEGITVNLDALDVRLGDADGQVKLDVSGSGGIHFGFGFDLSDVTAPVAYITDQSEVFVSANAALGQPVDLEVRLSLADLIGQPDNTDLPTISFAIKQATAEIEVRAAYGLQESDDGRYAIGEITSDDLEVTVAGRADVSLPLFFGENLPVGGTTNDNNGNGFGDNVLHLAVSLEDASLSGGDFEYDLSGPGVNELFSLGALLNDPQNMLDGLEQMFAALDSDIAGKLNSLGLPLLGDKLQAAAGFVVDLRDEILGVPDPQGVYSDGKIGQRLQSAIANDETVVEVLKAELYRLIGGGGSHLRNLLRVPDLDVDGKLQYDASGRLLLKPIESLDDIGVTIRDDALSFNLVVADTLFSEQVPLSFDASLPGLGLTADTGLDLEFGYTFGLGFGISGSDLFFVDTSGVTDSGAEFTLDLSATLKQNTAIEAQLGFLKVEIEDALSDGRPSGLFGSLSIDLRGNPDTGRWSPIREFTGLSIEASLTAEADVDLLTTTMFDVDSNGLQLPTITSTLRYDQVFASVVLSPGSVSTEFGGTPLVVFDEVKLDLGGFITGFAKPVVDQVAAITDPIKPVIEVLTKDIGILKELGAKNVSLLSIAGAIMGPTRFAPVQRGVEAIADIIDLVDTIDEFTNTPGSLMIDLGSFTVLGGQSDSNLTPSSDQVADVDANVDATGDANAKNVVNKFGKSKGSFRFPLLTEPTSAFGLLLGQQVDLFAYDMPGLGLNFNYTKSFPVFPGLNARLSGRVSADTDFVFGFDSSGLQSWADDRFVDPAKIFAGFFVDDQLTPDGRDLPEVSLSAAIAAGASIGIPGLVEAGVEGGIRANIGLNLNDVGLPGDPNGPGDGRLRFNEIAQQLDQGPACLFDMEGELSTFLDAFFWVGLDTFLGKITVFEARQTFLSQVLADFDLSCPVFDATIAKRNDLTPSQLDVSFVVDSGQNPYQGERYTIRQETNGDGIEEIVVSSRGFTERFEASGIATINVIGSSGNDDYAIGDNVMANVVVNGQGGDDVIRMFRANTNLATGFTRTFHGGTGDDTLIGSDMIDVLRGNEGNDILIGGGGADDLDGNQGDDLIQGGDGADWIQGGPGTDKISGDAGDDTIYGDVIGQATGDRDFINAGDGDDVVYAQGGDDAITGAAGADSLFGGDGDDTFSWTVGEGHDPWIDGGSGNNTIEMTAIEGQTQSITDTVTVSASPFDPADVEVRFDSLGDGFSGSTTLVLHQIQVLNLNVGEGPDSITANDLTGTLLVGLEADFGTGEILQRVPITEIRSASSMLIRETGGDAIVFDPAADLAANEVIESTFIRQRFESGATGTFEFEIDGTPKLIELIDASGNAVVDVVGDPIFVQSNPTGTPLLIGGQFVLDEFQSRSTVVFEEVPLVFLVSDPLDDLTRPLGQSFQRYRFEGGQYQFNADGTPLMIDSGGGLMVQENVGGVLVGDANGDPILEWVERRTIDRSRRTLVQQFDPSGNPIPGQFEMSITPQFGIDSFEDTLRVIGTLGNDDFILREDGERFYANQLNGVEFVVKNSSAPNDQFIVETLGGNDTILAERVQTEFLQLVINAGGGDDRIVGSSFGDIIESGLGDDTVTGGRGEDAFTNAGGSDTLLEQRDSNFNLTDATFTVADLVIGDVISPAPRDETTVEIESIAGLFDTVVLRGFSGSAGGIDQAFVASEGGETNASVNVFTVSNFSGNAILDGGWGGDFYRITLNDTNTTREQSLINIVDSDACFGTPDGQACVIPNATFDNVYVEGTAGDDIFWLTGPDSDEDSATGGYIQRLSTLTGSADDLRAAFAALGEFTADINTRNATGQIAGLFRQIVDYRSTESSSLAGLEGDDLFIVDDNAQPAIVPSEGADPVPQMNLYGDAGADRFFIGSVISTKEFEGQTVVDEITPGVSYPVNFWGGSGNDYFEVNHNLAEIFLYGQGGDDTFFLQAHLTTISDPNSPGSLMAVSDSATMNVTSEEGQRDILSYVRNAAVNVIGGDGFDTLVILGTARDDVFYIVTEFEPQIAANPALGIPFRRARVVQKIYGAGLIVNDVTGIERIVLLTGAGDDTIYLYATLPNQEIQIVTGSGDDIVYVGGESISNIPIVVPERTETRLIYEPQPDIVTYEQILVQAAQSFRLITGYQLNLGFVKAFPIYTTFTIPAVYRTEERRTPQDPLVTVTEVSFDERNELVNLPEVRNVGFVQSPIIIDGNAIENVSNDRIIFDHGKSNIVPPEASPIGIGLVREQVEVVSIETNDMLLSVPEGADPAFFVAHVQNELRDLHRIRRRGLIDEMIAAPSESTDIKLRPGRVFFRLNQSSTGNLGQDFVNLGVVTNVTYDSANDLVVANVGTTLAGPEQIEVDIEMDRDDAGEIIEIRVILAETIVVTVPNSFVVSKTIDSTTEYDTTQVFRSINLEFPIPENYGIYYTGVNQVDVLLSDGNDLFIVQDTSEQARTRIEARGGNDTLYMTRFSGTVDVDLGSGNDVFDIGDQGVFPLDDIQGTLNLSGGVGSDQFWLWANGTEGNHSTQIAKDSIQSDLFDGTISYDDGINTLFFIGSQGQDLIDIEFGRSALGIPDDAENRSYFIAGGTDADQGDEVHANFLYATGYSGAEPLVQVFGAATHFTALVESTMGYGNFQVHNGELRIGSFIDDASAVLRTDQNYPAEYTFDTGAGGFVGEGPVIVSTPQNAAPTTIRLVGQEPSASVRIGAFANESEQPLNLSNIQSTLSIISSVEYAAVILNDRGMSNRSTRLGRFADGSVTGLAPATIHVALIDAPLHFLGSDEVDYLLTIDETTMPVHLQLSAGSDQVDVNQSVSGTQVNLGDGNNHVKVFSSQQSFAVVGGAGTDRVVIDESQSTTPIEDATIERFGDEGEFVFVKWGGAFDVLGPPTQTLPDRLFPLFGVDELEIRSGGGDDQWLMKSWTGTALNDFRIILNGGAGDDLFLVQPISQMITSILGGDGDDQAQLEIAGFPIPGQYDDLFINLETLVVDNRSSDRATQWTRRPDWMLTAQAPGNTDPSSIVELIDTSGVDRLRLFGSSAEDSLIIDPAANVSAVTFYGPVIQIDAGLTVLAMAAQKRYRDVGVYIRFDGLTDGVASYAEDGFLVAADTNLGVQSVEAPAATTSGIVTLRSASSNAMTLRGIEFQRSAATQTIQFTGTLVSGSPIIHTATVVAGIGKMSVVLPTTFENLQRVTWQLMGAAANETMTFDDIVVFKTPQSVTGSLIASVPETNSVTTEFLINTSALTINGIASGGQINGTTFTAEILEVFPWLPETPYLAEFRFQGDLVIPNNSVVRVTNTYNSYPVRFIVGNDALIGQGVEFRFGGEGQIAGPGGGIGGYLGRGGQGGELGLGGDGGDYQSGGSGGLSTNCSPPVPAGSPTNCVLQPGNPGKPGQLGTNGFAGAPGLDGTPGSEGQFGFNGGIGGAGGTAGLGGVSVPGGLRSETVPAGGISDEDLTIRSGQNGNDGGAGTAGMPGNNAIPPTQPSVVEPLDPYSIVAGGGGGAGAGGGGGSAGGGGAGGSSGGSGAGGRSGYEYVPGGTTDSYFRQYGGRGGYSGAGGQGGRGGFGGWGGDGSDGGGGGGAFELIALGRVRIDSGIDESITKFDVSGGQPQAPNSNQNDRLNLGFNASLDAGYNYLHEPNGVPATIVTQGVQPLDGGGGGAGGHGGSGGLGGEGGAGSAGTGGGGGTTKLVGSVLNLNSSVIVDAGGGDPESPVGRLILGANHIVTQPSLTDANTTVRTFVGSTHAPRIGSVNPFLPGAPTTPNIPDLIGGAEAYGVLKNYTAEDFASMVEISDEGPVAAVFRMDVLDFDKDPTTFEDFTGYDVLLVVNLLSFDLVDPTLGISLDAAPPTSLTNLLAGGIATDPMFGGTVGSGSGGAIILSSLTSGQVWATLVPESTARIRLDTGNGYAGIDDAAIANGEVKIADVNTEREEVLEFEAIVASPDGSTIYAIDAETKTLSVIDAADLSLRERLRQDVNGVTGLPSPSALAISPNGDHLYVLNADSSRITVFDTQTVVEIQSITHSILEPAATIAVHANGSKVLIGDSTVDAFSRNPNGTLQLADLDVIADRLATLETSLDSQLIYSVNQTNGAFSVYRDEPPTITDLDLDIDIDHPVMGELTIALVTPWGATYTMARRVGGTRPAALIRLDDEATVSIFQYFGSGTYIPNTPLRFLDGRDANGTWTLRVIDDVSNGPFVWQTLLLDRWSLRLRTSDGQLRVLTNNTNYTAGGIFNSTGTVESPLSVDFPWWRTQVFGGTAGRADLAISSDDRFIYVTSEAGDSVQGYQRNLQTGVLTLVQNLQASEDLPGLINPSSVTVTSDDRFIIFASELQNTLAVYARDLDMGTLSFVQLLGERELVGGLAKPLGLELIGDDALVVSTATGLARFDVNTINPMIARTDGIEFNGIESARINVAPADFNVEMLPDAPLGKGWDVIEESDHVRLELIDLVSVSNVNLVGSGGRSLITGLEIVFDGIVDLDPDAFMLTRLGSSTAVIETDDSVSPADPSGNTVVTLTFSGDGVRSSGGSLEDGKYQLTIDPSRVRRSGTSVMLDGNGDGAAGGEMVFGADAADDFFSLFGDADGDRDVDGQDYGRFGMTFLKSMGDDGFNPAFDYDDDGDVDGQDYGQFRLRLLRPF